MSTGPVRDATPLLPIADRPEGQDRPPKRQAVLVRYSDGTWRGATVLRWLHDPGRGWLMQIRWHTGQADWRVYDEKHVRPI